MLLFKMFSIKNLYLDKPQQIILILKYKKFMLKNHSDIIFEYINAKID